MNPLLKRIVVGAASGFTSAFLIDLNAWSRAGAKGFDWKLAASRWLAGAVGGVVTGLGLGASGAAPVGEA